MIPTRLRLTSEIEEGGGWVAYQEGTLAAMLPLEDILAASGLDGSTDAVLLCGTLPAIGGVRAAPAMRMALEDAARGRRIELSYRAVALPEVA